MVLKIAHRGAKGYGEENTINAFRKALTMDIDAIELDIRKCKTGELIVIHDETVERTTNGRGLVTEKTFSEIRKLRTKDNQFIPTLQESLDVIDKKTKVAIELKVKDIAEPISRIIKDYVKNKGWNYNDFIIFSFHRKELHKFHSLVPEVPIVLLILFTKISHMKFVKKENVFGFGINFSRVSKRFIRKAHERNIKVFTYTLNQPRIIKRAKKIGVDGIISDYPDRI
ncbi:MAG TPA: glycerophosphodiester phosphodiesterase family protein [Candidatus Paceibacterota bacterium]|nr:glycerophosphodiester phosphodiesterase family protein [Candidatus Paceibacterota bacterium]